jgi:hypothetical protein
MTNDAPDHVKRMVKSAKPTPSYEDTKLLAGNPKSAQDFIDSTKNFGGASMNLKSMKLAQPGDPLHIVGKEPSKRTGKAVETAFVNPGESKITPRQFALHFNRLKGETDNPNAMIGSWFDNKTKKSKAKGVQLDLSVGHRYKKTAERKMIDRNEDAIFSMTNMRNTRHEAARKRHGITTPRPPKEN